MKKIKIIRGNQGNRYKPASVCPAEQSVELEAENWRLCSATWVRGVSGELEDEEL